MMFHSRSKPFVKRTGANSKIRSHHEYDPMDLGSKADSRYWSSSNYHSTSKSNNGFSYLLDYTQSVGAI